MKYHREAVPAALSGFKVTERQRVILWLVGFPGYIVLLFSWGGACAALCIRLVAWFVPEHAGSPVPGSVTETAGQGAALAPFFTILLAAVSAVFLACIYWLAVRYTALVIQKLAAFLETSVWVVKFVGVPLGCGLVAVIAMLFRPDIGLKALAIAVIMDVIGLGSFGLEYGYCRYITDK